MRIILFISLILFSVNSYAAKLGQVDAEETILLQTPNANGTEIEVLQKDTYLIISNYPIEGFFKVRTKNGTIGFVSTRDVHVVTDPNIINKKLKKKSKKREAVPVKESDEEDIALEEDIGKKVDRKNPLHVSVIAGQTFFTWGELVSTTSIQTFKNGFHLGVEFHVPLSEKFGLALRVESLTKSHTLTNSAGSQSNLLEVATIPMMLGANYILVKNKFMINTSLFLGVGFNTAFSSIASDSQTLYEAMALAGLLKFEVGYFISDAFFGFLEVGYRYLNASDVTVSSQGTGSTFLQNSDSSYKTLTINLGGLVLGLGVSLYF